MRDLLLALVFFASMIVLGILMTVAIALPQTPDGIHRDTIHPQPQSGTQGIHPR